MNIFLTSQASWVLEKIVSMLPKEPSDYHVLFIPTAANPYAESPWVTEDRDALVKLGFTLQDLDLAITMQDQAATALRKADIVFIAGGNTFYLLEKIKQTSFDDQLKEAVSKGKIFIGSSAGSVVAAPDIKYVELFDDPSEAKLENTKGLGLVTFSVLPHAGNPKYKALHEKVKNQYGEYNIVLLNDDQFVIPKGDSWEVLS